MTNPHIGNDQNIDLVGPVLCSDDKSKIFFTISEYLEKWDFSWIIKLSELKNVPTILMNHFSLSENTKRVIWSSWFCILRSVNRWKNISNSRVCFSTFYGNFCMMTVSARPILILALETKTQTNALFFFIQFKTFDENNLHIDLILNFINL